MADSIVYHEYGAVRAQHGDHGELHSVKFWQGRILRTLATTTGKASVYLTHDGTSTGRKIFTRTPSAHVQVLKALGGANAAITDQWQAWPFAYGEATGLLEFTMSKIVTTTPTIAAVGDGEFTFLVTAIGL